MTPKKNTRSPKNHTCPPGGVHRPVLYIYRVKQNQLHKLIGIIGKPVIVVVGLVNVDIDIVIEVKTLSNRGETISDRKVDTDKVVSGGKDTNQSVAADSRI